MTGSSLPLLYGIHSTNCFLIGTTSKPTPQAKEREAAGRAAHKAQRRASAKDKQKRKAEKKLRKAAMAGDPAKQDKNRKRMLIRADKLEAKAKKFLSEAAKARARAKVLEEKTKVRRSLESFIGRLVADTTILGTASHQDRRCNQERRRRNEGRREFV